MNRHNVLLSDAVDHLVKTVARCKDEPMLIVIPRIITFGLNANNFEVVILLLKMMNKQLCIEVVDNFGMPLVDMAREYEKCVWIHLVLVIHLMSDHFCHLLIHQSRMQSFVLHHQKYKRGQMM
jgi:hypothetical protein